MFAEDVGLLPKGSFTQAARRRCAAATRNSRSTPWALWGEMDRGVPFSSTTNDAVLRFNGGLFQERAALPLKPEQSAC